MVVNEGFWTERQAALFLNVSVAALRRWRRLGMGPTFARFGRLVRYRQSAVEAFAEANSSSPGSDEQPRRQ